MALVIRVNGVTCCVMPAIANAIFAATGKRLRRLSVNPELLRQV